MTEYAKSDRRVPQQHALLSTLCLVLLCFSNVDLHNEKKETISSNDKRDTI